MTISIIAALGERNRVIGRGNDLPWSVRLKPDMARFKEITTGHPVIMGRKTWFSIPEKFRPLPDRENIVISRQEGISFEGAHAATCLDNAIEIAERLPGHEEIFIIGGGQVYEAGMLFADRLYLTLVDEDPEGDVFFPEFSDFPQVVERSEALNFEPRLTYYTLSRV